MTIDAKAHGVVDRAFGDRHLGEIAMTHGAFHSGADVRRMIEPHV